MASIYKSHRNRLAQYRYLDRYRAQNPDLDCCFYNYSTNGNTGTIINPSRLLELYSTYPEEKGYLLMGEKGWVVPLTPYALETAVRSINTIITSIAQNAPSETIISVNAGGSCGLSCLHFGSDIDLSIEIKSQDFFYQILDITESVVALEFPILQSKLAITQNGNQFYPLNLAYCDVFFHWDAQYQFVDRMDIEEILSR